MPKGGFLGKVDKEFKKGRNYHDAQVEKCKNQIDRINELNGSKITYDRETANVQVPMYGGQTENFQWHWLSGDRGKREKTIEEFKQILNILEARNNPAQYNSLVSNLNASTKNALDVNIKKHNITVPTQQASQEELVEKALVEAERGTKVNDITTEFKEHFSKLNPDGVVAFMHRTKGTTINVDGCVGTALRDVKDIKYPAMWKGVPTQELFKKHGITNPYFSFDSKIEPSVHDDLVEKALIEAERGTKVNDVTAEFKDHFSKLNPDEVVAFMHLTKGTTINVDGCVGTALLDNALNIKYPATWNGISTQKFFVENGITNPYASFDSKIEPSTQSEVQKEAHNSPEMSNTSKVSTAEEDSDDDIEVISKILGTEVTLTNGAKYEVKKIIDLLDKPNFIKQLTNILSKLSPEDSNLVQKEIALKLAYISNNDMDKYEAVHEIVDNMPQTFIDEFNNYDTLTLDQMRTEEAKILGDGVSYL